MSSLRNTYNRLCPNSKRAFSRTLTDDGLVTGNNDMDVDGSVTPVRRYIQPLPEETFNIEEVSITISDNGSSSNADYGSVSGPLTNGTVFFVERDGVQQIVSEVFDENDDFVLASASFEIFTFTGVRVIVYRDLFNNYSNGIFLNGATNDKFGLIIRDDLSSLVEHISLVKGYSIPRVIS